MPFAARRIMLAITLIYRDQHVSNAALLLGMLSVETDIDGPLGLPLGLPPLLPLFIRQHFVYPIAHVVQGSPFLGNTIPIQILRVHAIEDIICNGHDDSINFQPIVQSLILALIELADFLVFELLDVLVFHAVFLQAPPLDIVGQLLLEFGVIVVGHGDSSDVSEATALTSGGNCAFQVVRFGFGVTIRIAALEAVGALASHYGVLLSQSLARMLPVVPAVVAQVCGIKRDVR